MYSNMYVLCMYVYVALRLGRLIPELPDFIQASLNARAGNDTSEIEVLLGMANKRGGMGGSSDESNWTQIEAAASQVNGPCAKYARVLAAFARVQPKEAIEDLAAFYKAFATMSDFGANRFMGSEFLTKLAATNFGKMDKFPWILNAAFKANLRSSGTKNVDGYCKLVTVQHLSQLSSNANRAAVRDAEQQMIDARKLCKSLAVPHFVATKCIGNLDCRLALILMKLQKADSLQLSTFDAVGQAIFL